MTSHKHKLGVRHALKNRKSYILNCALSLALLSGLFGVVLTKASAETNKFLSPTSFLDPDGMLKLNHSVSGLINLQGWNVKVDDERGPIFSAKNSRSLSPIILSTPGEWSALGSNLAGNDGALNLRFGNLGTVNTQVKVFINGVLKSTHNLAPNQSRRISYDVLDAGPVVIQSSGNVPIIASMRVLYFDGTSVTSFSEMMGLPQSQWSTTYLFTWYNNLDLNTLLLFGIP